MTSSHILMKPSKKTTQGLLKKTHYSKTKFAIIIIKHHCQRCDDVLLISSLQAKHPLNYLER